MATPAAAAVPAATTDESRAKEEALLSKANAIKTLWKTLSTAFSFPQELPPRNKCHWDFVLQESAWLAHDVMQERLWKRAAAYHLSRAAALFDRKQLKPTKTTVCQSLELPAEGFGKVKDKPETQAPTTQRGGRQSKAAKEAAAKASAAAAAAAAIASQASLPTDDHDRPVISESAQIPLPVFIVTSELQQLVIQQLEEEDVARLSKHAEALARYAAMVEEARKAAPVQLSPEEEELLLGRRKARRPKMEDGLEGLDGVGVSPLGLGVRGVPRGPGRPSGLGTGGMAARADGLDNDARGRKRKAREYGDEEYDLAAKAAARDRLPGAARPPLGPGPAGLRPDGRPDLNMAGLPPGMGMDRKAALARGGSLKSPPGKAQMMGGDMMGGRMPGMPGRGLLGRGPTWTPQDEQVLVAFVTEFGQNWPLVADVMRAASTMQGISRSSNMCKQKYLELVRQTLQIPENVEVRPEQLAMAMMQKQQAKDILSMSLPVTQNVLAQHQQVLVEVVNKLQARRMNERNHSRELHKYRTPEHTSHPKMQQTLLQQSGGRFLNPIEIGVVPSSTGQSQPQAPVIQPPNPQPPAGLPGAAQPAATQAAQLQGVRGDQQMSQSEAAIAAAAQANAAAQQAAANALAQQQQQGLQGHHSNALQSSVSQGAAGATQTKIAREQIYKMAQQRLQTKGLQQMEAEARSAAQLAQANPTPETNHQANITAALFRAASTIQHHASQQQQALMAQQQAGMGLQGQPSLAGTPRVSSGGGNPLQPGLPGPTASVGTAPTASGGNGAVAGQQNVRPGNSVISAAQLQNAIANNKIPASAAQTLMPLAESGKLTMQYLSAYLKQHQAQQQANAQQNAAMGLMPGMSQPQPGNSTGAMTRQASGGQPTVPGQMGWPGQLPNAGTQPGMGLPNMHGYMPQQQQVMNTAPRTSQGQ